MQFAGHPGNGECPSFGVVVEGRAVTFEGVLRRCDTLHSSLLDRRACQAGGQAV
jgi:hypothetical protein